MRLGRGRGFGRRGEPSPGGAARAEVPPQLVARQEPARAVAALEGELGRVFVLQVLGEQFAPAEEQVAELASVRARACVQALVGLHVALLGERLEAELALEGPLARVRAVVALQGLLVDGRVTAEAAVEAAHVGTDVRGAAAAVSACARRRGKRGEQVSVFQFLHSLQQHYVDTCSGHNLDTTWANWFSAVHC